MKISGIKLTDTSNLLLISQGCHQYVSSPTFITNIEVANFTQPEFHLGFTFTSFNPSHDQEKFRSDDNHFLNLHRNIII